MSKTVRGVGDFPALNQYQPLPHEVERRKRIQIAVATYAYEIADSPIMPDAMWDWCAGRIDRRMGTGHPLVDEFFLTEFSPMTGMWIHDHPELGGISRIFTRYHELLRDQFMRTRPQIRLA